MTSEEENDEIGRHALELANGIEALCKGRPYAAVLTAFAMVLAGAETRQARPDINEFAERFSRWLKASFEASMARRAADRDIDAQADALTKGLLQ